MSRRLQIQMGGMRYDKIRSAQRQGRHVPNGWPHYSSRTGLCMCLDPCCMGESGCRCKFCPCQYGINNHELRLTLGNTISWIGEDGERNGLHNHHPSGGRNNNGLKMEGINKMEIQVMYLVNGKPENNMIGVRQVVKTVDARLIFGDDLPEVGQIQGIYVRLPWQPDAIIEFLPRPTFGF